MKRLSLLIVVLFLIAACSQHGGKITDPTPPIDDIRPLTMAEQNLVTSDKKFAFKIFEAVNSEDADKNIFISPFIHA